MRAPRLRSALVVTATLAVGLPSAARATEIGAPPPLGGDLGRADGRALLARWSGRPAPERADQLVAARPWGDADAPTTLLTARDGRPAIAPLLATEAPVPPVVLASAAPAFGDAGFFVVLDAADAADPAARLAALDPDGGAGSARFDVRPADSNPIALGGDVLDEVTARVVRTPEPGTLALFALGAAGLAALVARRRRRD